MTSDNLLDILQRGTAIPQRVSGLRLDAGNGQSITLARGDKTWTAELYYGDEVPAPSPVSHVFRLTEKG